VPEIIIKEDDTLKRASQGDQEAFGLLYEQYVERIFTTSTTVPATSTTPRI